MRYMIAKIEAPRRPPIRVRVAFFAFLNQNGAGTFFTDGSATTASAGAANGTSAAQGAGLANGNSKYTDARFLVKADGTDYERAQITASHRRHQRDGAACGQHDHRELPAEGRDRRLQIRTRSTTASRPTSARTRSP